MNTIFRDKQIRFEWRIRKSPGMDMEHFERANLGVFLIGGGEIRTLTLSSIAGGVLEGLIPSGLPAGVYDLKAMWTKNEAAQRPLPRPLPPHRLDDCHNWELDNRCLMVAYVDGAFAVTDVPSEETEPLNPVLKINSFVATYGYDGMSAYESAVLRGLWSGTESEYLGLPETIREHDETATANEAVRVSAEAARVAAETARVAAESLRESKQIMYDDAELVRVQNESERVAHENARLDAEEARGNAELLRQSAEDERESAEEARAAAETARESAEVSRSLAENSRANAESARVEAEAARAAAETARASAEAARVAAETARAAAETSRQSTFDTLEDEMEAAIDNVDTATVKTVAQTFTDAQKEQVLENIEFLGTIQSNSEYIYAITDAEHKFLFGIKADGSVEFAKGLPTPVKNYIDGKVSEIIGDDNITEKIDSLKEVVDFLDGVANDNTLVSLFNAEKSARESGDSALQSAINTEAAARQAADSSHQAAIATKVDKVEGKGLSTNDFTDEEKEVLDSFSLEESSGWINVEVDAENKILSGTKSDGSHYSRNLQSETIDAKVDKEEGKGLIDSVVADSFATKDTPEERLEMTLDQEGKVVAYRKSDGVQVECVGIETPEITAEEVSTEKVTLSSAGLTDLERALKANGFVSGTGNWSDYISEDGDYPLHLPTPRCAILNVLSDKDLTTLSKKGYSGSVEGVNYAVPTQVEFWDLQGNYFKKWTEMSAQGASSMGFIKKNLAFDFFDDETMDGAFVTKFGDWVPQDSYHLKAYYTDFFRGAALTAYSVAMDIDNTKGIIANRNWKKALLAGKIGSSTYDNTIGNSIDLRIDTDARCMPDGFPVIVYQNGEFYGIFAWQLKKHRDNYHMSKSNAKHIHLDGTLSNDTFFNGTIDWTMFEVRNPKNLVYAAVHSDTWKYDADLPGQFEIAGNADGSMTYAAWSAGSYAQGAIRAHEGHIYLNTIADNTATPVYHSKNNSDNSPDFKNKTGCGWLNVTNTVKVKASIIALAKAITNIDAASDAIDKKALFDEKFDAENIYEYMIVQAITGDYDGNWGKNWQWTTWDGNKWYVNEYDKDCTFGADSWGGWIAPPYMGGTGGYPYAGMIATTGPQKYMNSSILGVDYHTIKKDRYKALRASGVITAEKIIGYLTNWVSRIGEDNYAKEYAKWSDCICNRDMVINSPWELYPPASAAENLSAPVYDATATYSAGDACRMQNRMRFKIPDDYVGTVTGVVPVQVEGHRDNIYRFENWVKGRIDILDEYCGYNE